MNIVLFLMLSNSANRNIVRLFKGVAVCVLIFYTGIQVYKAIRTEYKPCHSSDYDDTLPSAEDPRFTPKSQSIFFHETSCKGTLYPRQACAVEAAARAHPEQQVYVLFSVPVTKTTLNTSCLADLNKFHNINFARVHIAEYLKGTPAQTILHELDTSKYPVHHSADVLRMVTLNKWGGTYLDTDMIVTRSLESLPINLVARERDAEIGIGLLRFAKDEVGTNITNKIMREISNSFDANDFIYNGAMAVERVLDYLCPGLLDSTVHKPITYCHGVSIYSPDLFYPYDYSDIDSFFKNPPPNNLNLEHPYAYHMWNLCSESTKIFKNSTYELVAKTFCPTIYAAYPKEFGNL